MAPLFSAGADSATVVPPWGSAVVFFVQRFWALLALASTCFSDQFGCIIGENSLLCCLGNSLSKVVSFLQSPTTLPSSLSHACV